MGKFVSLLKGVKIAISPKSLTKVVNVLWTHFVSQMTNVFHLKNTYFIIYFNPLVSFPFFIITVVYYLWWNNIFFCHDLINVCLQNVIILIAGLPGCDVSSPNVIQNIHIFGDKSFKLITQSYVDKMELYRV